MKRQNDIRRIQRTSMLILLFTLCISPIVFAEEAPNVFIKYLVEAIKWFPNTLADFFAGLGVNTENIYMPGSPFMFSFSQNNIFGIFTAMAYPIFKTIAVILISPTIGFIAYDMLWSGTSSGKKDSFDKIKVLIPAVLVMWFLPDILNQILQIKDSVVVGLNNAFSSAGNVGFIDELGAIGHAGTILDSIIYLGAVLFAFWLMFNYLGLSFGFAVLFLYTPVALILTPAKFGKQVFGEITKDFVGFCITPMLDITLLGIVTIVRGATVSAVSLGMSEIIYNLISIGLIMMVIPTRSKLKQKLGMGSALGDSLGTGLAVGTMAMMMRGAKKSKANPGESKTGNMSNDKDSEDYQDQADYHSQVGSMQEEESLGGGIPTNSSSSNASGFGNQEDLDDDFLNTPKGRAVYSNFDKAHFNEKDFGGLSNKEKSYIYSAKANEQREVEKQQKRQSQVTGMKGFIKGTGGAVGTTMGMGAGMFFGAKGVAVGGLVGNKLGKAVGGAVANAPTHIDKMASGTAGFAANAFKKRTASTESINMNNSVENDIPSFDYDMSADINMGASGAGFDTAEPSFDFGDPNIRTDAGVMQAGSVHLDNYAQDSISGFNENMDNYFSDYRSNIISEAKKNIEVDQSRTAEIVEKLVQDDEMITEAHRVTISSFERNVSAATDEAKSILSENQSNSSTGEIVEQVNNIKNELHDKYQKASLDAIDASEVAGVDLRQYMSKFIGTSKVD